MSDHPVPPPEVSRGKGAESLGPAEARNSNVHSDAYARDSTVTDRLRLTRGVMPEAEINARSFLGAGLLPSPGDQGITGQSAEGNTAEFNYNPEARTDKLLRATRSRDGGVETLEQQYKGRADHLDLERFRADTHSRGIERTYEKGQRADGLNSETIYRDEKTEGFERIYEPGKDKQGLLQHTFKKGEGKSEETRRFDPEKNNQKVETETRTSEGDRSTLARTFGKGRSDGLTSFTFTSENGERTVKRSYADGAEEQAVKHKDGSIDKTRSEHDGPTRKTHIEADGRSRETETYDKTGKLLSIEGQDSRGKFTATRVEDSVSGTISQRSYGDGTVATVYPKDKPGPGGAAMIIQEKGKASVSLDAQGKPVEGAGDGSARPLAVATVFGENGTVRRTFSDGSSSESNLKDYTATSSGAELARNTGDLARLASSPEHRQAIDGLIKAAASTANGAADGSSNTAGDALVKLAGDPSHSEAVRLSATGRLGSQNSSERQIAADLLARTGLGSGSDSAAAIIRNPSTEMAAALGRMPADQVDPHRTAIVEGLNKAATSERHGGFSADHRNAAIAVVATAGGAEALKAAGLEVKEQGDLTTVKSKDGSTLTFASEKGHLQLKSIESPAEGGIDSETEKKNFDASTGKITSIDHSDKYGKYNETQFRETEHGTVRQRTYDETKLVRTIFGDQQILQQKGKPAETIDAQGHKSTAPDSNPVGVATSFEEPGKVKSIYSDGGNKVESLHDFVERSQPQELARLNQRFENLAASGPEQSRQGSIDALVKIAASGDNGAASAVESLGRLSAEPALTEAIARSILATTNGGRAPARGSDSDQASPPSSSDRAVMLLAATTGRAGLEKAGLKVDEQGASATTSDGWKYNLEKGDKGQLRPSSVEKPDGSTKVEFSYARDGGFTGSVERRREVSEAPDQKYQNIKLPPLQKGWGPYQALEQLRSEGKINMSNAEMKVEAERIRDREFKNLGRNYFKVGESFDMYASGEKPGTKEDQGKELSISRSADGKVERMVRGDGSSVNISYENGKPSRVSDGVGPDLISADGGKTWQFQKPEKSDPQKDPPPPYKAQLKIDTEKGTVSLEGEDRSRLEVGADGSRKFVGADGKETYIFKPPVKVPDAPERERRPSDKANGRYAPGAVDRSRFDSELSDPAVMRAFAGRMKTEVGSQGSAAQLAWAETVMNRAVSRNQTLMQALTGRYYPTHSPGSSNRPDLIAAVKKAWLEGTDTTSGSTGNASGSVGFGRRGKEVIRINGEKFGYEEVDLGRGWMKKYRQLKVPAADTVENSGERTARERSELPKEDDRGKPVVEVKAGESIQKAIDKAPDGAIIHVGPGVYREQLEINRDNITLRGDGRAVIDLAGKKTRGAAVQIRDRHNVRIDGFEIRNVHGSDTPTGIRVEGASRDIVIANNNIHHVEDGQNAHGIAVFGDSAKPARSISIVNNDVHHLKLGQSESVVVNGNVDGFRITGNKIHDNDNIGIDIIGYEGTGRAGIDRARNGVVSGNHVYNIDSGKNPSYGGDRSAAGIYVDGGSDIVIEDNLIQNSNYGIELASEHRGKNTARVQVRRNRVDGSHLAGISLGGGSSSNGGVSDSIIENNDLRNNKRPVWRQHHVGSDVILRHNDSTVPPERRTERRPERETERETQRESPVMVPDPGGRVTRSNAERASFYRHQDDGVSCSAFSMAMMASDHLLGRPVSYGKEARSFKVLAGVTSHGYRGSLETMAKQLRTTGLDARAYEYDTFGKQGMTDLNAELDKGHSAVARVRNPHTGNAHYIYIAGRTADGKYIIGDPDRHNRSHMEPVTAKHLYSMMSHRNGFVAGWAGGGSDAIRTPGTFAYRYRNNGTSLATNR